MLALLLASPSWAPTPGRLGMAGMNASRDLETMVEASPPAMYKGVPVERLEAITKKQCCWSKWGTEDQCGSYVGPGAKCNTDPTKSCVGDSDCPDPKPAPPAPPSPPGPKPGPPSPPKPPTPLPGPPYKGFWFGWVGSHSNKPAPSSGWFLSFPGLPVNPPFTPSEMGTVPAAPKWGNYSRKILTQGGGDTGWGDAVYAKMKAQLPDYKPAGWDGVCWDWEKTGADHTTEGFNALMKATKDAGLLNILTSTAEGPYVWSSSNKDATGIDWSLIDFFVPQMYGAAGTLPTGWEEYAKYWTSGANKPNIHDVTFAPIPMKKFLWGMPVDTCDQASSQFGGSGCIEWAYSPGVRPPPMVEQ